MKKRLRKKVSKRKCLKCGNTNGLVHWYKLKSGRWIGSALVCDVCDLGHPKIIHE